MRVKHFGAAGCEVAILVYTYDPAERAVMAAFCMWCEAFFENDVTTRHFNWEQRGYESAAHCTGFDLYATKEAARKILSAWRSSLDSNDLKAVDEVVGRAGGG